MEIKLIINGISLCHLGWSAVQCRDLGSLQRPPPSFNRDGFYHVNQAGLELLTSSEPLASASQSAGITAQPSLRCLMMLLMMKMSNRGEKEQSLAKCENRKWSLTLLSGWSAVVQSQLTATSASWIQVIFLPQSSIVCFAMLSFASVASQAMLLVTDLKLLSSSNPPALAFQSVGITTMSHHAQPEPKIKEGLMSSTFTESCSVTPGWSSVAQSQLTATSASKAQATLSSQS
ncbi:hypothetical protein AAY473_015633 [Plecturocebus cupreus]